MIEVEPVVDTEIEAQATEPVEKVEVDLSAVPEKHREYVDVDKYQSDEDYKRAVEHGWKPREVFLADGGDEADWTGHRQFNRRYDDRQSIKAVKEGQDALLRTLEQQKAEAARLAVEQERVRLQEELRVAASDGDVEKALDLQQKIGEKEQQAAQIPRHMEEPPVVVRTREQNPFLDKRSEQFDPEINAQFERICTQLASEEHAALNFGVKDPRMMRPLTNLQVKSILQEALDMVKDKVKKPQVAQKAPSVAKPAQKQTTTVDYKKSLPKEWQDTYNRLLTAKGGGKEAADAFAKEVMGGVK